MFSSPRMARACALLSARRFVVATGVVVVLLGAVLMWGRSSARAAGPCTVNVTPSTFSSAVSSAAPGTTICLASGDYGTWSGTNKAITITPVAGATPQIGMNFGSSAHGFTIDGGLASFTQPWGLEISHESSPDISGGASNITIENTNVAVGLDLDSLANSNVVFNHDLFHDLNGQDWTAALHLGYTSSTPSGVTVENSLFRDMSSDAIQTGISMSILKNEFSNVQPNAAGGNESIHTDSVQLYGATNTTIIGNFIHNGCEQGIGAFDGTSGNTVEDNVVVGCTAHSLVMGGDNPGSLVEHNTILGGSVATIDCTSKSGEGPSNTTIINNIASGGLELSGGDVSCKPAQSADNLVPGGKAPNLAGTPQFIGGANSPTYAGFQLTPTSPGHHAGTDGLDVGARIIPVAAPAPPPAPPAVVPPASASNSPHRAARPSHTRIRMAKVNGRKRTAKFGFTAKGAKHYQCALIRPAAAKHGKHAKRHRVRFGACGTPKSYGKLKKGKYTFEVRGVNSSGVDPHPARKVFKIA
jgi:hypothetical protein